MGYSPLCFFLLGIFEVLLCVGILFALFDRNFIPEKYMEFMMISFLLPIYRSITIVIVIWGLFIGFDGIIGIFPAGVELYVAKWFLLRAVTESLSIFFLNVGVGVKSIRSSLLLGFLWTSGNFLIIIFSFILNDIAFGISAEIILCSLIMYYLFMWLLPPRFLHRRPAYLTFSCLNCFLLCSEMIGVATYVSNKNSASIQCSTELIFSVDEFIQLIVILKAFCDDSLFWQGILIPAEFQLLSLCVCRIVCQFKVKFEYTVTGSLEYESSGRSRRNWINYRLAEKSCEHYSIHLLNSGHKVIGNDGLLLFILSKYYPFASISQ